MHQHEIIENVHRLLLDNLPVKSNKTSSGWITFNCPMCNDNRKRAGIKQTSGKISFNCFNCSYTTGWAPSPRLGSKYRDLAERLGASTQAIHQTVLLLMKHSDLLEESSSTDYVYSSAKFDTINLPESVQNVEDLDDDNEIKQYATERGILGAYPLLHFDDLANKRRVIVPFTYNGELVGWTGRHIAPPDKKTPKYLSNMPSGYVFNVDAFIDNNRELVIVTEGVFDAILIDGVSVLGNHVTAEQAHLISKLNKRVILCPDRDSAGKELIDQGLELGWEISFPPWDSECKDAADAVSRYGRLLTVSSIIKYATDNKIKAQVKAKML